eukprot:775496-Pelagomonas_calceolata.AAC.1
MQLKQPLSVKGAESVPYNTTVFAVLAQRARKEMMKYSKPRAENDPAYGPHASCIRKHPFHRSCYVHLVSYTDKFHKGGKYVYFQAQHLQLKKRFCAAKDVLQPFTLLYVSGAAYHK